MDAINDFINKITAKFLPYILISLLFLSSPLLSSCESGSGKEKHEDSTASQVSKSIIDHANKLGDLIPSSDEVQKASTEEIEKTFAIEYRIVDIKLDSSTDQIQNLLSTLGKERWDCFSSTPTSDGQTRLFCKRRSLSALRALLGVGGMSGW